MGNRNGGVGSSKNDGGLQCPWSNCFPQIYGYTQNPCTMTTFPGFREILDHIWKYHSALLSCDKCSYRFQSGKRAEKDREELNLMKTKHSKQVHPDNKESVNPDRNLKISRMSYEGDELLKKWKPTKGKGVTIEENYGGLCRCLFGEGIKVPENPKWHYFKAWYEVNNYSAQLGEKNIEYAMQRYNSSTSKDVAGHIEYSCPAGPSWRPDPFDLDEDMDKPPFTWEDPHIDVEDSGYGSVKAPQQPGTYTSIPYENPMTGTEDYRAPQLDPTPTRLYQNPEHTPWVPLYDPGGFMAETVDPDWHTVRDDVMDYEF